MSIEDLEREGIELASFKKRLYAFMIDDLLISMLFLAIYFDTITSFETTEEIILFINSFLLEMLLLKILYQSFFVYFYSATIGKIIMKIRVVDGKLLDKPSLIQSINRAIFRALGEFFVYFGFIIAFLNPKREALHDKSAKTLVINV